MKQFIPMDLTTLGNDMWLSVCPSIQPSIHSNAQWCSGSAHRERPANMWAATITDNTTPEHAFCRGGFSSLTGTTLVSDHERISLSQTLVLVPRYLLNVAKSFSRQVIPLCCHFGNDPRQLFLIIVINTTPVCLNGERLKSPKLFAPQ